MLEVGVWGRRWEVGGGGRGEWGGGGKEGKKER